MKDRKHLLQAGGAGAVAPEDTETRIFKSATPFACSLTLQLGALKGTELR